MWLEFSGLPEDLVFMSMTLETNINCTETTTLAVSAHTAKQCVTIAGITLRASMTFLRALARESVGAHKTATGGFLA